jgi:hypothetical protein
VKRIAIATAAFAALLVSAPAPAAPGLWPHVYGTAISGSKIVPLNAAWRMTIQRSTFALARNGSTAVAGSVRITGSRVTFHDLGGAFACRGAQAVGTYTWRLKGAKLTFTRVKDACAGRRAVLAHTFTRIV